MDKEQVLLAQMLESWKDIRSFGTTIWQVTGLSLASIGLVIGQALWGTYNNEPILTSFIGLLILFFVYSIALIALSAINWLVGAVISRADMIHQMERRFQGFDVEIYSHHIGKLTSKGNFGFGFLIMYEWKELPSMLGFLFSSLGGGALVVMQTVGYQLISTQLVQNLFSIFVLFLLLVLFYTVIRSITLRSKYVKKIKPREIDEKIKELESSEDNKESTKNNSGGN